MSYSTTIIESFTTWANSSRSHLKPATVAKYSRLAQQYDLPAWLLATEGMPAKEREDQLWELTSTGRGRDGSTKPLTPGSQSNVVKACIAISRFMTREGALSGQFPADTRTFISTLAKAEEQRRGNRPVLSIDQISCIMNSKAMEDAYEPRAKWSKIETGLVILLLRHAPVRLHELLATRVGDIRPGIDGGYIWTIAPETKTGMRSIALPDPLIGKLYHRMLVAQGRSHEANAGELLFPGKVKPDGTLTDPRRRIEDKIMRVFQSCGITGVGSHAWRRSYIIAAIENGIRVDDLKATAGVSDVAMRHYTKATAATTISASTRVATRLCSVMRCTDHAFAPFDLCVHHINERLSDNPAA